MFYYQNLICIHRKTAIFAGLHGLVVRFIAGNDTSNGYIISVFLVIHFADSGYNKREQ